MVRVDRPVPRVHVGLEFQKALEQPMSARWSNIPYRTVLRRFAEERRLAILRDRRLDPDKIISLTTTEKPARAVIHDLAATAGGAACIVGSTIYLAPPPPASAGKLRTMIALRRQELDDPPREIRRARKLDLRKRRTIHWNDLDRPADILQGVADRYRLTIAGPEKIPHDLWAGGTIPQSDAAEALSLILIQFDLTFRWKDGGDAIELIPVPERGVTLIRSYTPRRMTAAETLEMWKKQIPSLMAHVEKKQVVVEGSLEQHETVAELLKPKSARPPRPTTPPALDRQRLTLRVMGVPATALMRDLEKRFKIQFEYDAARLKAAGVDLERKVDVNVKQATIEAYLDAIFSPLGAATKRDRLRVTITPQ